MLFARTPRFGIVKTRLARDIGKIKTLQFYRNTLSSVTRRLKNNPSFNFHVALTPRNAVTDGPGPALADNSLLPQHHGNLGTRMSATFRTLNDAPTLIIGSDIPDIKLPHINAAFKKLQHHDVVFGTCSDGGYWLVGLKPKAILPTGFMKNVRWSSTQTLNDTVNTLPKHWKVAYIEELDDIDDGQSYMQWQKRPRIR